MAKNLLAGSLRNTALARSDAYFYSSFKIEKNSEIKKFYFGKAPNNDECYHVVSQRPVWHENSVLFSLDGILTEDCTD